MSRIELAKAYSGRQLEEIFFRPIMTGPDATALGIRMMYNMPVPTTINFWKRSGDVLQNYAAGWTGGNKSEKYQKTISLSKVKAEVGYSAEDYFSHVFELITGRADVNLDDLSGTELETAETTLFRDAIAEGIRMTMWLGNAARGGEYSTFDGFVKRLVEDIPAEKGMCAKVYEKPADGAAAEQILAQVWKKAPQQLRAAKSQGQLAFFVTSDVYNLYEEALGESSTEAAYLARQSGREGLFYYGIPVIDLQLDGFKPADLPSSFVLLTDRRNLAMAVNTSDFPGTEVKMWYNPDLMENRQRAIFMAGCDYLLPEMVSIAFQGAEGEFTKTGVTASGGPVSVKFLSGAAAVESVKACGLNASEQAAGAEVSLTLTDGIWGGAVAGSSIAKVRFTVKYGDGTSQAVIR